MSNLVLTADIVAQLRNLEAETTLLDENGKPLGSFLPIPAAKLQPQISEEEIRRRLKSTEKRLTTAELLASLERRNVSS